MANSEHLALLKQGVAAWNKWRQANPDIELNLTGADLTGADLREADLLEADLTGANLRKVDLTGANLARANLREANFTGANLTRANLTRANLIEADLALANLSGANLARAGILEADLSRANLRGANLLEAHLTGANLTEANLTGADLREADFHEADLREADLHEADLNRADLTGANLARANLREANLTGANLTRADLTRANLHEADLREADLHEADLNRADLSGADLHEAKLWETIFANVNLAEAKNLDTCHHYGPSILDFRTLQQSDPLPLAFLKGCGLPDLLIEYLPSLLDQPIQYNSCFISYSGEDDDFAQRLHADLQNKGVRCWFAPEDIQRGRKLHEQIGEAIQVHEKLLLVLSTHSMNSEWVKTEIAEARQIEVREKRPVLFPIRLVDFETIQQWKCFDADTGKDSAREIREFFIPDFSNWKSHDAYQQAFDLLLRDLKPALERKPGE